MPKHPIKLIINPNADLGRAWRSASDLRPIIEEYGGADWTGTVYPTHATELARQAADEGYETVVAIGGDGTVHEVINGLMQSTAERRPRLAVVPMGTGNDFAHNIGLPAEAEQAVRKVFTGSPKKIDLALMKDDHGRCEYWNNTLGIGFDATVTIRSRRIPFFRGFLIYLIAVVQAIMLDHDAPLMKVTTDREQWQENNLMVVLANGPREGGGFNVSPSARVDDGELNYMRVDKISRPRMFRLLPEVMQGSHERFKSVRIGKFTRLTLEADQPLNIHTDGEIIARFESNVRQISVEILPGALEVLT